MALVAGVAALSAIPFLLAPDALADAAGQGGLAQGLGARWQVFVQFPLVALATCLYLFSPGFILALALNWAPTGPRWLVIGYGLGLAVLAIGGGVAQALSAGPVTGVDFVLVVAALDLVALALLAWRASRPGSLRWPLAESADRNAVAIALGLTLVLLAGLAPHLLWENFNGDGAHAFEAARLLLFRPFPFWDPGAGTPAAFPGMSSMLFAYPASWFIRLFGEIEVAVRLPFIPALAAVYGGIFALGRTGERESPGLPNQLGVAIILGAFSLAMAFSASYSPYSADLAMPGAQDTQFMAVLMAALLAFADRNRGRLILFTGLTLMALPSGLMVLGLWIVAAVLAWRPVPTRRLATLGAVVVGWYLALAALQRVLPVIGLPGPGGEYGLVSLLRDFAFLQLTDYSRLVYVVVPSGFLAAGALLAWKWQDAVGRTLTLTTVAYYLTFFVQAYVSLHHFVPAMILPVAVYLRILGRLDRPVRVRMGYVTVVAALVSVALSIPGDPTPYRTARTVARTMDSRFSGYERHDPRAFRPTVLLRELFPPDWDPAVPESALGGSELVWNYYIHHGGRPEPDEVNYILQPDTLPVPEGWEVVIDSLDARVLVRSDSIWRDHLSLRPRTRTLEGIYAVPRGILFASESLEDGPTIISVPEVLERLGVDTDPLIERFR